MYFKSNLPPGMIIKKLLGKLPISIIHTFPESIKDDRILEEVSRLHHSGGFLNKTLVEMENMSGLRNEHTACCLVLIRLVRMKVLLRLTRRNKNLLDI